MTTTLYFNFCRSLAIVAVLFTAACGGSNTSNSTAAPAKPATTPAAQQAATTPTPAPAPVRAAQMDPAAEAKAIFTSRCVTCHGVKGKGDGPGSLGLSPAPRDFSNPEWQATVTDEHIEKIIMYGGIAVGKSAAMPPNPDLMAKKPIVAALRALVRDLAKK